MTLLLDHPLKAVAWCQQQRDAGKQIGYVPTMGALHQGHRALVERAVAENDSAFVSIFVNPLQFNSSEDLLAYPTDLQRDLALLTESGCTMAYTGNLDQFLAVGDTATDSLACAAISGLEADHRPGHLQGVQTIVEKLFHVAGRCTAYFGEKDFQQTLLVKELAARHGEIRIVVCPTVREPDGLAMSSRNARLTPTQRHQATVLYRALLDADALWRNEVRDPGLLEQEMAKAFASCTDSVSLEYAAVRDPENWTASTPPGPLQQAQALIAAMFGEVRLIDNLRLGARR